MQDTPLEGRLVAECTLYITASLSRSRDKFVTERLWLEVPWVAEPLSNCPATLGVFSSDASEDRLKRYIWDPHGARIKRMPPHTAIAIELASAMGAFIANSLDLAAATDWRRPAADAYRTRKVIMDVVHTEHVNGSRYYELRVNTMYFCYTVISNLLIS